ncbi:MAG TPA: N-acyl homoserine lactonase family protein [Gemmatimonadales bacterium]
MKRLVPLLCLAFAAVSPQRPDPVYEVYAIRYGTVKNFPARYIVAGADSARRMDLAMTIWLMRGGGRTVLVDAGFHRADFVAQWKPADFVAPSEALAPLKVKPADVTDIIVSHIHWDHMDGLDLFPKAHVWVQRAEYEYYVGADGKVLHQGIDSANAVMLAGLKAQGRVTLVEGDSQLVLPGIRAYTGGRHTFASQYVSVHSGSGTTVLASDNCYTYENLEQHRPIAQTFDSVSNLAAQARMLRLASSPRLVVPGHDPVVFERFPTPGHGIARID